MYDNLYLFKVAYETRDDSIENLALPVGAGAALGALAGYARNGGVGRGLACSALGALGGYTGKKVADKERAQYNGKDSFVGRHPILTSVVNPLPGSLVGYALG